MEGFQAVLGFILGVVIFLVILASMKFLFMGFYSMLFFFFISLCLGMILAKFLSWLVIILIVIGIGFYIYCKLTSPPSSDNKNENNQNEETNQNSDEETKE